MRYSFRERGGAAFAFNGLDRPVFRFSEQGFRNSQLASPRPGNLTRRAILGHTDRRRGRLVASRCVPRA
jgi:hypothetical protein